MLYLMIMIDKRIRDHQESRIHLLENMNALCMLSELPCVCMGAQEALRYSTVF